MLEKHKAAIEDNRQFQTIRITLTDGRTIEAAVPAFCNVGEKIQIVGMTVSPPQDLAPDEKWWVSEGKEDVTEV